MTTELALEIICCYPELMKLVNEKGESPLYVLASKPSIFDSTTHHYDSFFYRCKKSSTILTASANIATNMTGFIMYVYAWLGLFVERLKQQELEEEKKKQTRLRSYIQCCTRSIDHTDEENQEQHISASSGISHHHPIQCLKYILIPYICENWLLLQPHT